MALGGLAAVKEAAALQDGSIWSEEYMVKHNHVLACSSESPGAFPTSNPFKILRERKQVLNLLLRSSLSDHSQSRWAVGDKATSVKLIVPKNVHMTG